MSTTRFAAHLSSVSLAVIAGLLASPAYAQTAASPPATATPTAVATEPSSDIIVTARRRDERLQDVPVAITAISSTELADRHIDNSEALRYVAPALQVSPGVFGKAVPAYTIRSQRSLESLITLDPAVGIYFAEQVQQRPHGTNASLYDLASVEVLKGPQGTLFGRNTTGGAILINPQRPTRDFEGSIGVEAGDYALRRVTGVVNIPLSDSFMIRAAGRLTRRDGYVRNLTTGLDTDDERTESARFSALWKPADGLTNYTVVNYFHENDNGGAYEIYKVRPGSATAGIAGVNDSLARQQARDIWTIENSLQPFAQVTSISVSNITTLQLGSVALKNIAGYRHVHSYVGFDYDGTAQTVFESRNLLNADQWTEELQASGNVSPSINYIGGLFYFREQGRDTQDTILFGTRANDGLGINTSYSAYAQFGVKLAPRLNLTLGGRYTQDRRELVSFNKLNGVCRLVDAGGVPLNPCIKSFEATFRAPSWLASLDYKFDKDTLVYVSTRRGYRSGGWNLRANRPTEQLPFDPETVYDVEVGVKATLFDHHLQLNGAVYNQWYSKIQRALSFGSPLMSIVLNAGRATIRGGELEATLTPTKWIELSGNVAYSDAKYNSFTAPGLGDLTANTFAFAPKWTYSGSVKLNVPMPETSGQVSFGVNYYHITSQYITDLNTGPYLSFPIPGYGLVDINATWRNVAGYPIDLAAYVKNVGNRQYYSGGTDVYASTGFETATPGEPRHFGVSLTYRFGAAATK